MTFRLKYSVAILLGAYACFTSLWVSARPEFADAQTQAGGVQVGCTPITTEQRAGLQAMGAAIPANGQFCERDKKLLYGGCEENPYPYLQTKNKTGRPDTVSGLNSDFACRAMKFLKAADAAGMKIDIGSGYRSVPHQTSLYNKWVADGRSGPPVAPPGRSKHNFGLAIDLSYNGKSGNFVSKSPKNTQWCIERIPECKWAHENYSKYNLRYPMSYEPWHIEPSGAVNGRQQPQPVNGWDPDNGGGRYSNNAGPFQQPGPLSAQQPPSMSPSAYSPAASSQNSGSSGSAQTGSTQGGASTPTPTNTNTGTDTSLPLPNVQTGTTNTINPLPTSWSLPTTTTRSGSLATTSQAFESLLNYNTIRTISSGTGSSSTGVSSPTSASATGSARLNTDLEEISNTIPAGGNQPSPDTEIGNSETIAMNPAQVTETFSRNPVQEPTRVTAPAQSEGLIRSLLVMLRDFLATYLRALQEKRTDGFSAPWQPRVLDTYQH
jgi:hypothetical protein